MSKLILYFINLIFLLKHNVSNFKIVFIAEKHSILTKIFDLKNVIMQQIPKLYWNKNFMLSKEKYISQIFKQFPKKNISIFFKWKIKEDLEEQKI